MKQTTGHVCFSQFTTGMWYPHQQFITITVSCQYLFFSSKQQSVFHQSIVYRKMYIKNNKTLMYTIYLDGKNKLTSHRTPKCQHFT